MQSVRQYLSRLLLLACLIFASPTWALAKDDEPAAQGQTPFFIAMMFVMLFIALGIMAIVRSTTRSPDEE